MELAVPLSADLAAIAGPAARGAAPLLHPTGPPAAAADGPPPFEMLLALLTGPHSTGEPWPTAGKELPVLPLDAPTETDAGAAIAPTFLPALVSPAFAAEPPLPAGAAGQLPAGLPATGGSRSDLLLVGGSGELLSTPTGHANAVPSAPKGESPTSNAATPVSLADIDSLATIATAETQAPLDAAQQQAANGAAKTVPTPSWLEAFGEGRLQRPVVATPAGARAGLPAEPARPVSSAIAIQPNAAIPAAATEASWATINDRPRIELLDSVASTLTTAHGASTADWLLPTAGHGTASSAAAPATPAVPGPPVDLRSPNWHEAFANRVQWLVDTQVGEAHIKLNPPELGAVDVKISLVDDKTYVQLTTATAAARDELTQSLPRLRELFTGSGLELGGASISNGGDGQQAGYGHGQAAAHDRADGARPLTTPFASFGADRGEAGSATRRALGRIDTFA